MPKAAAAGWGRAGHRRAVLIGAVAVAVIVGGGVTAWAEVSAGSTGYRMATVTRATIGTTLPVVGNVEPVSDAAASFQVSGQVATLTAAPGEVVTAGQTLGTLDTTAQSESVSSAQSTLNAAEAKLIEDEENQASAAAAAAAAASKSSASTTTTTITPAKSGTDSTVMQDQTTLTQDESTLSTDQQKEGADLVQAQSACKSANTSTPAGQSACEAALQTVSTDEQIVSKDQTAVSKDETALGQALGAESSGGTGTGGGDTGNSGTSPTQSGHALTATTNAGSAGTGNSGSGNGSAANGSGGSTNTDTPEQIASDQAAIDTAEADLTNAQQALNEATLTSPIDGTIVSVGIAVGDTVSANSSTEIITIIGTNAYEVQATLDSSQIPSVKVGQPATVEVDGVNGSIAGTVAQVGPVQSGESGYTYPVVVALPTSTSGLFAGSTANVTIATGTVSNVVAVPTSAVQTLGTRAYVLELSKGQVTRKVVKVGMVGGVYTQVLSGLTPGQSVVLADYAEPVPSSNTNSLSVFGGGGGGFFGGGGAGTFRIPRGAGGGGGATNFTVGG